MNTMMERWREVNTQIRALNDELYLLKEKLREDFINSHTDMFDLPCDTDLNWRKPSITILTNNVGQPIVALQEWEFRGRIMNGQNTKHHRQGTRFTILKSWKTGKTKGTHYLLYNKRTKLVANFYG